MTEGHGDDSYKFGRKPTADFSSNIHTHVDHSRLIERIAAAGIDLSHYPDPLARPLAARIASWLGVGSDCVMVTNGVTEAIYLIARSLGGRRAAIVEPTFSEYGDACREASVEIDHISDLSQVTSAHDIVWLCNPNNPTGRVTPRDTILSTAGKFPDTIFVIDQAYSDYTLLPVISPGEAISAGNMILLGSFTKRFSLPALRIGYAVAPEQLIAAINSRRLPWSVNSIAIAAAILLLDDPSLSEEIPAETLHSEALRLAARIQEMGIEVLPTDCNFILCRLPEGQSAADMKLALMNDHGLLIRDASNFYGLTPSHFRVAAQTVSENNLLIDKIEQWLHR